MRSIRQRFFSSLVLIPIVTAVACSGTTEPPGPPAELTALPRALSAAERQVIAAGNDFSFSLFRQLSATQPNENLFVSPLSASMALGMTLNGAAAGTFDAMRGTLGFGTTSQPDINAGYRNLIDLLRGLDGSTQMELANSIWYRQGFPFQQSFLDVAHTWFDAEVRGLDFANTSGTLNTVNGWVNEKTHGRIPTILQQVAPEDVMYLINAIYFKGSWRLRFDPSETRPAPFHAADGGTGNAQLMYRKDTLRYLANDQFQAVDLLYGNGAFTMTVLLPRPNVNLDGFIGSVTRAQWDGWMQSFRKQDIKLYLPKVKLTYTRKLNDDLKALGMAVAFDDRADFSRMADPSAGHLFISFVLQKAFVDINEEGTEAAAATVVGIGVTSAPLDTEMRVDRPYLFVIRERLSGTILFMGKVTRV